jgi:hypothetical protein
MNAEAQLQSKHNSPELKAWLGFPVSWKTIEYKTSLQPRNANVLSKSFSPFH